METMGPVLVVQGRKFLACTDPEDAFAVLHQGRHPWGNRSFNAAKRPFSMYPRIPAVVQTHKRPVRSWHSAVRNSWSPCVRAVITQVALAPLDRFPSESPIQSVPRPSTCMAKTGGPAFFEWISSSSRQAVPPFSTDPDPAPAVFRRTLDHAVRQAVGFRVTHDCGPTAEDEPAAVGSDPDVPFAVLVRQAGILEIGIGKAAKSTKPLPSRSKRGSLLPKASAKRYPTYANNSSGRR